MIVVVALTAALLLALAIARRGGTNLAASAAGLATLGAGLVGGALLNDWLFTQSYDGPRLNEASHALSSLDDLAGFLAVAANLAGQAWYLLVATLGVVLLLFVRDVPPAVGRLLRRRAESADILLTLVVLATVGLLVESALWFPLRSRPDQLIYGRYVEPVAPILVALSVVALVRPGREPRLRALMTGLAGLTVLVAVVRAGLDIPEEPSRWNVASLPSVTGGLGAPIIVAAGVTTTAALSLLALVRRRAPGAVGPVMLLLFAPTTAYIAYLPVLRSEHDMYPAGWTSPTPVVEQHGGTSIGYDLEHHDHIALKAYQWFMPHTRIVLFQAGAESPPTALFFSGRGRSGKAAACRARVVWSDPGRDQVLWQAASDRCGVIDRR
jgi:hypothetical protein